MSYTIRTGHIVVHFGAETPRKALTAWATDYIERGKDDSLDITTHVYDESGEEVFACLSYLPFEWAGYAEAAKRIERYFCRPVSAVVGV